MSEYVSALGAILVELCGKYASSTLREEDARTFVIRAYEAGINLGYGLGSKDLESRLRWSFEATVLFKKVALQLNSRRYAVQGADPLAQEIRRFLAQGTLYTLDLFQTQDDGPPAGSNQRSPPAGGGRPADRPRRHRF